MDDGEAARYAGIYLGLSIVTGLVGVAIAGAGVYLGGLEALGMYRAGRAPTAVLRATGPGLALVVAGVLVWWFGNAFAVYKTLTAAIETSVDERLNTEAMKSDILSVLDERLSEMHQELSQTRRAVDRGAGGDAAGGIDFEDEF